MKNPYWIEDGDLGNGPRKSIPRKEITFWNEMIEQYLKPLEKDADKEKQVLCTLFLEKKEKKRRHNSSDNV